MGLGRGKADGVNVILNKYTLNVPLFTLSKAIVCIKKIQNKLQFTCTPTHISILMSICFHHGVLLHNATAYRKKVNAN